MRNKFLFNYIKINRDKFSHFLLFLIFFSSGFNLFANQILAEGQESFSSGSSNKMRITLSNTMQVTTSANTTSNMVVDNEGALFIEPGSTIQDSFGDETGKITGELVVTPTGSNFEIDGISAKNNYIIGEGTYFKSSLKSIENPDPDIPLTGNASSGITHNMVMDVEQVNSSFTTSFSTRF